VTEIGMKLFKRSLALLSMLLATPASATDLPQGADTLKLLANEADLIASVTNPAEDALPAESLAEPGHKYRTYTVMIGEVVKGSAPTGSTARVSVAEGLAIENAAALDGAIVFLRAASSEQLNSGNLPQGVPVYTVVSGRFGVIGDATPELLSAVRAYAVQADAPAGTVSWAARHARSPNRFLQRSAIMDLYFDRDRNSAFEVLRQVVTSGAIHPENRSLAIEALEETGKAAAKAPLRSIAEDAAEPIDLRASAVRAFAKLPQSEDQLRRWLESGDPVLRGAASDATTETAHATHDPH
jgi:hypothetical protein